MELSLDHVQALTPTALITTASLLVVSIYLLLKVFTSNREAAVPYTVDLPSHIFDYKKWITTAQTLDKPSIQISGSSAIQCYCPANGKLLGTVNPSTPDGIDRAIAKAKEAQVVWSKTAFWQRRRVLNTMLKYVLEHQDDIVQAACLDSGKPRVDAALGELLVTAEKLAWTVKHGEAALKPQRKGTNLLMCYKRNEIRYEPLGVLAACVSWNYPFHNLVNPMISALFTGNSIIVKCSEQTAWSSKYFGAIARGALEACGHSPNLVQVVACWPSAAEHLTSHPDISHLLFIGSQKVAKAVSFSAAKSLTPLCLELGGKDAAVILDSAPDSDLPRIASILMRGVYQSAGQNCIGVERVVACPAVYPKLLAHIESRVANLRVGSALDDEDNVDVGACISPATFDGLEQLIKDAVSRGARLLHGGKRYQHPNFPKGHYFEPTLLVDVTSDMSIAQQELFAPVFALMRAESTTDAIRIANSTPYSLGASVFGRAGSPDIQRATNEIKAGMLAVNDFASYYMCSLPFGGVGGSGYGRFGGEDGLRSLCNAKSICADRFGFLSTSIPPRLDYTGPEKRQPGAKAKAWNFVKSIVFLGYATSWKDMVSAMVGLAKNG